MSMPRPAQRLASPALLVVLAQSPNFGGGPLKSAGGYDIFLAKYGM
ncbi:MAG: hypothetical protein HY744_32995 [Deltaproteobacteria bacterium]|nr:hypothetical protein [Deltaproteobacteria bacterium]